MPDNRPKHPKFVGSAGKTARTLPTSTVIGQPLSTFASVVPSAAGLSAIAMPADFIALGFSDG